MEDEGADGDEFFWDSNAPAAQHGLDFFSEPPSATSYSSSGRDPVRRRGCTGLEGLDLNSQAMDINDGTSYLDLLRSSSVTLLGEDDRGGAALGSARVAAGATGRGTGGRRRKGAGEAASTAATADHDLALDAVGHRPSRAVGGARGSVRGVGRCASFRPPAPKASRPYRAPRPTGGQTKLGGAGSSAQETPAWVQDSPAWDWSQNPNEEEADEVADAETNPSSCNDEDEAMERCSSSDDDEMKSIALRQLELVQQCGAAACMFGMYYDTTFMHKTKSVKTGLSGYEWVMSSLSNPTACYNMFRMSRELFYKLHDELVCTYGLKSSKKMSSVESLAMFLWVIGAPQSIRQAENRFERSTETVSRKFNEVLGNVFRMSGDIVKPRDPDFTAVHSKLQRPPFSPHFENCIGAMDGTHIPVVVPSSKLLQYVGRHGYPTQNVLVICDFDMRFTFAVAGWPGSVHDMRVFNDAINKYGDRFPHPPPGKFYVVDSGFPNRPGYLAPYKETKYHVPEFRKGPRPRGRKEATYGRGTRDEVGEFIYQLCDVNGDGVLARSDLESVLASIHETIFTENKVGEGYNNKTFEAFVNSAVFSKDVEGVSEKSMSLSDFRNWCTLLPSMRKFLGNLLMPPDSGRSGFQVPVLHYPENISTDLLLLNKEYAWHIGGGFSQHEVQEWKLLYHSSLHGQSFNTFLGKVTNGDAQTVLIVKDTEGSVYGGYASQPWERHSDFYGDMKTFLFKLYPSASIFRPTGANKNLQWCAINFSSENIPNGIGFGGQPHHFGLFLSANFDQGHSFTCSTFTSPPLSKTNRFRPEVIECWGIQMKGAQDEKPELVKGTVLERFKEDRNMLKMVGLANASE